MVTEDRRSRRLDLLTGGVASRHSAMLWPALHDWAWAWGKLETVTCQCECPLTVMKCPPGKIPLSVCLSPRVSPPPL